MYRFLSKSPCSILLDIYPKVGLLDPMVILCLIFWGTTIPINSEQGLQLPQFLTSTYFLFLFLIVAILMGVQWCSWSFLRGYKPMLLSQRKNEEAFISKMISQQRAELHSWELRQRMPRDGSGGSFSSKCPTQVISLHICPRGLANTHLMQACV